MKKKKINLLTLILTMMFSFGVGFSQSGASGFTPTRNKQSFTNQESFNFLIHGFLPTWVTSGNVYNPDFLVRLDVYRKFARIGIINRTNTIYNALYREPFGLGYIAICNQENLHIFLKDSFTRKRLGPGSYLFNYLYGTSIDHYKARNPYQDEYVAEYHGPIVYSYVCHNANGDDFVVKTQKLFAPQTDSFETNTKSLKDIKTSSGHISIPNVRIEYRDSTVHVPNLRVRYRDTVVEGIRYRLEYEDSIIRIKKYVLKNDTVEVPVVVEKLKITLKEKDSIVYIPKITIQENKNTITTASSAQKTMGNGSIPPPPATMIPPPPAYMYVSPPPCTAPVCCTYCGQYHQVQDNCCVSLPQTSTCNSCDSHHPIQEQKLVGSGQIIEK